jgi:hypothetical protein
MSFRKPGRCWFLEGECIRNYPGKMKVERFCVRRRRDGALLHHLASGSYRWGTEEGAKTWRSADAARICALRFCPGEALDIVCRGAMIDAQMELRL